MTFPIPTLFRKMIAKKPSLFWSKNRYKDFRQKHIKTMNFIFGKYGLRSFLNLNSITSFDFLSFESIAHCYRFSE